MMRTFLRCLLRILAGVLLVVLLAAGVTGFSPVYDFRKPAPFTGEVIFNPYRDLDTTLGWKRAAIHTHTKVKGPFPPSECDFWPQEIWEAYRKLGYDIVTFSNHNEITPHPFDPALQVNVYEQGYSPFKFHKLVFGSRKVKHYDPLVPLLASQKQFELDRLGKGSDFIQVNHPYRTWGMSRSHMRKLTGYQITELDSGIGTENAYWDWSLSAGHYTFGLANDDLHYPDNSWSIGVRCDFLNTPSGTYGDLKKTLLGGCYYAMRVPNYGEGDWDEKYARNRSLPYIRDIGMRADTIYLALSAVADSIRVNGQDHRTLALVKDADRMAYVFRPEDRFARLTAFFPDGEVIYTNPFARHDPAMPLFDLAPQKVNIPLSILFNLGVALWCLGCIWLFYRLIRRKKR